MTDTGSRKTFSVFGDSISTLQGMHPDHYLVQYRGRFLEKSGVRTVEDTWWGMVIAHFGGRLLRNDAYSGSTVACLRSCDRMFPSACSRERIDNLAAAGEPDVLMVYLGTNDWDGQVSPWPQSEETPWWRSFEGAYGHMLSDLKARFPQTELWCLNLTCSAAMLSGYPQDYLDTMPVYNGIIADLASRAGARLVDLYSNAMGYPSADMGHPSRDGMQSIAAAVIGSVVN